MRITFNPAKNARNIAERGLAFTQVLDFEWSAALIVKDERFDYGESRYQALGFIGGRLHVVVFTPRDDAVHVISFRKANKREVKNHGQKAQS
ncbi:BrnT family toxin [Pseudomonas fragi]|uniref:BrnT family toxin n=1 Tax=Pseudomonas fragi TaxID=296 RepID=UPI00200313F1|nr:BrnT family toxin [Pseudomonas fragi]